VKVLATTVRPPLPTDLRLTLSSLRRGPGDPAVRFDADGVWLACLTPSGPGTVHLAQRASGDIEVEAWGDGAEWLVSSAPDLCGARDSLDGWDPPYPILRDLHVRHPGFRVPRTGRVMASLVPAIVEQRVVGQDAWRSWRRLLLKWGSVAPGPRQEMRVMPAPSVLASIPSWEWHALGVEQARARVVRHAATLASRLEETVAMTPSDAMARLRYVPGVGPWTAAETAQRALGDADAVSVGDLHLPGFVGWVLLGHRVDDDGMLELLEPVRGHRYRATRLLELSGVRAPRFGPRYAAKDLRTY
jgi:3-methyladenine DNA glycosylase/8-oxoguanine DNA glycosylase